MHMSEVQAYHVVGKRHGNGPGLPLLNWLRSGGSQPGDVHRFAREIPICRGGFVAIVKKPLSMWHTSRLPWLRQNESLAHKCEQKQSHNLPNMDNRL